MRVILFDMDGTLLHSELAMYHAVRDWFTRHNLRPPDYQEVMSVVHKADLKGLVSILLPPAYRSFVNLATHEIDYSYTYFFMPKYATLVSGAFEVVSKLKSRGYKIAIATNATRSMLQSFKLRNFMNVAISADDVDKPKPSPCGILKALDHIGIEPERAIFVGDTKTDIAAGINAGTALNIGVLSGIDTKEDLERAGADYVIDSIALLPKLSEFNSFDIWRYQK